METARALVSFTYFKDLETIKQDEQKEELQLDNEVSHTEPAGSQGYLITKLQ